MSTGNSEYEKTKIDKKIILGFTFFSIVAITLAISLPLALASGYKLPRNTSSITMDEYENKINNKDNFVLFVGSANNPHSNYLLRGTTSTETKEIVDSEFQNYSINSDLDIYIMEDNVDTTFNDEGDRIYPWEENTINNLVNIYSYLIELEKEDSSYSSGNFIWFGEIDNPSDIDDSGTPNAGDDFSRNQLDSGSIFSESYEEAFLEEITIPNSSVISTKGRSNYFIYDVSYQSCSVDTGIEKSILFNYNSYCYTDNNDVGSDVAYQLERDASLINGSSYGSVGESIPTIFWFGTKPDNTYGIKGILQSHMGRIGNDSLLSIENYLY